jgi:hypothetical protein
MKGIRFKQVGKHLRSVYDQNNGDVILADECTCNVLPSGYRYEGPTKNAVRHVMCIERDINCPIDQHRP